MKWFIIACVVVAAIMIFIRFLSNSAESAAEKRKNEKDRAAGKYNVSENQSLADRYKK